MKFRMKIFLPLLVILLSIQSPQSKAGGIPVFDGIHTIETVAQIIQLAEQIQQAYDQIMLAEDHIDKVTGLRGLEHLLSSVYDNDFESVLSDVQDILDTAELLSADDVFRDYSDRFQLSKDRYDELYNSENEIIAKLKAQSDKYLDSSTNRFEEITKLISKLGSTSDQKDVMDLQARAQGENAMLVNEQMKVQMVMSQLEAEEKILNRKKYQHSIEVASDEVDYDGLFENIDWD